VTKGERTRARLLEAGLALFEKRGYQGTTLRDIAAAAGVSVGLMYRYFPAKQALVLALYDRLSAEVAARLARAVRGGWAERFATALRAALAVLAPHRDVLRALLAAFVLEPDSAIFAPATAFSRQRVQAGLVELVRGAPDAKGAPADAERLGRALYLALLGLVLFWLLDRSRGQAASRRLARALEQRGAAALAAGPLLGGGLELVSEAVFGSTPARRRSRRAGSRA